MEEKKILEMIEAGKITAAEGLELLSALKETEEEKESDTLIDTHIKPKKDYKFLKIKVDVQEEDTKVNVNIPLKLLKAVGGLVPHLNTMIPNEAKSKMKEKGVDLTSLKLDKLLEAIELGELEDTVLVDITANDEKDGPVQVKIYVE